MNGLFLAIDWKLTAFAILGGLGIFLYGINLMSDSLKKIAGSKLRQFLENATNTPLKGIFVGLLITAIIQSSSATTAIVVGLVRAGLMTLPQAVGVIFGANIGTTVTSFIIALKIGDYAFPIMFVGSVMIFFFHKKRVKEFGRAILGFGMLFFGLETMGDALKQLVQLPEFTNAIQQVADYPILGVVVGVLTTAVIQSSSATIGILEQLYATGGVPLIGAIAVVLGDNIGTTVTSIMAAAGGTAAAKRTALTHVLFNLFGTVLFLIFLTPYYHLISYIGSHIIPDYETNMLTISLSHILFNLINVFIMYWFIKQLVWLVTKLIPAKGEIAVQEVVLEEHLIDSSPDLALENAKLAISNMGSVAQVMFDYTVKFTFQGDAKIKELGLQCEELLDVMDDKIHAYLVKIGANDIGNNQIQELAKDIDTITDLERIGDHLTNLLEFFEERQANKMELYPVAKDELTELFDLLKKSLTQTIEAYKTQNKELAMEVNVREDLIDKLCKRFRKNHINRINDKTCQETEAGFYVDILSNMERLGDHCNNIVINILTDSYTHDDTFF